jgi:putative DNA primase/helicase
MKEKARRLETPRHNYRRNLTMDILTQSANVREVSEDTQALTNVQKIRESLSVLCDEKAGIIELRAWTRNDGIQSGFYSDLNKFAEDAAQLDESGDAECIAITMNPVSRELFFRSPNRLHQAGKGETTADEHVLSRRWLLIDFDPVRDSHTNSTSEEHAMALNKALAVREWLTERGWPMPVLASSGNGIHLLYRIELANDDAAKQLVRNVLKTINEQFSDGSVEIDTSVSNASRVVRLYGTTNRKGENTEQRPQRLSQLFWDEIPLELNPVSASQLQELLPPKKEASLKSAKAVHAVTAGECIPNKRRNSTLTSLAGTMRRRGMHEPEILAALLAVNERRCEPPLLEAEVRSIAKSISRYSPQENFFSENEIIGTALATLIQAPLSDAGNAECMAALYGSEFRYDHTRKKWLVWDGIRWSIDEKGLSRKHAVRVVRARHQAAIELQDLDTRRRLSQWGLGSENINRITAMLQMGQVLEPFSTTIEQYDSDVLLAATQNGTLDLRDGSFRESRPEDFLTRQLRATFDSNACCPRWEQFLNEIFGGDEELISYIQRAFGYSLTGNTSEQVIFLCYGNGANGKSVFLDVLSELLGDYAGTASFETFDAGRRSEASNDLAALKGKRIVTVIETEEDRRLAEAKVKAVTGQDAISCRFLYGEYFTYIPQFKIWMAINHLPIIRGVDRGIWRRIRVIPFLQSFEGRADKGLNTKLRQELSGILNWALKGIKKWQEQGLGELPKAMKEATEEYRRDNDSIGQWIEERTRLNPIGMIRAKLGYDDYSTWAEERGEHPFNLKNWGRSLAERGYRKGRNRDGYHYFGLELAR